MSNKNAVNPFFSNLKKSEVNEGRGKVRTKTDTSGTEKSDKTNSTAGHFVKILKISALLPRADRTITSRYSLSRKQIYLIYLVHTSQDTGINTLKDYADILNISLSTLTRNIEKLERRNILERVREKGKKSQSLRLLSMGQLNALEISGWFENYFKSIDLKRI